MDRTERSATPTASEWDRAYMRRIGRWKHEGHEIALAEHLALSGTERLVTSVVWTRANLGLATWSLRTDDQPERFYERAKELGLYRP
ncbi:MAG: hypothetical protein HY875_16375 [Chloroflexi bacterium]|nr:hypothetical protein [Chloroflexota bacterium]